MHVNIVYALVRDSFAVLVLFHLISIDTHMHTYIYKIRNVIENSDVKGIMSYTQGVYTD